ncbi:hypothetical protein D3C80_993880 [compost metagenome]|nr:conserved protein of unknown function [Pseudomonas sp. JV241A]
MALELDVGRRGTQLARQLLPVQHAPADAERPAQQALGQGEVGTGQGIAHLRAADPQAVELDGLRFLDGKALEDAGLLEEVEITDPVAAEAEIVAHFQVLDAQAVDQDGVDELGGAELAQALVERQAQHPVDACGGQQGDLVAQAGQARGRGVGGKVLTRLWLENHHAAGHAQLVRSLTQARQDCLVAAVNTVEVANSGDTAPVLGAQVVEASNQLHNALLAHKVVDYNHTRALTTGSSVTPWRGMCKTDV